LTVLAGPTKVYVSPTVNPWPMKARASKSVFPTTTSRSFTGARPVTSFEKGVDWEEAVSCGEYPVKGSNNTGSSAGRRLVVTRP